MESGREPTQEKGITQETDKYTVRMDDLYMKGSQVRGSLYCTLHATDIGELSEEDVKISKQNIKSFLSGIQKATGISEDVKDDIFGTFYALKTQARQKAMGESSEAEYSEQPEQLDVDEDVVNEILEEGYIERLLQDTDAAHVGDYALKTVSTCSALSKNLTDMPINLWSIGESGAGKTHCFKTVFKTLPEEYKVKFNSCSPKALYYFVEHPDHSADELDGKVVLFNEAEASQEAVEVLRSITDPDEEDANLASVMDQQYLEINIKGSPITWFTSVDPLEDTELQNRFLFSNPEGGSDHKDAIARHQRKNFRKGELQPIKNVDFSHLKAAYRKIVEDNRGKEVIIPFNWTWNKKDNPRLQQYFANLLYNITLVHYKNRPMVEENVVATLTDYYMAKFLWKQIEDKTIDRVKEKDIRLINHIPEEQPGDVEDNLEEYVTRSDLQEVTGRSYTDIRHATERLMNKGLIKGHKAEGTWHFYDAGSSAAAPAIELENESLRVTNLETFLEETLPPAEKTGENEGARFRDVAEQINHLAPSKVTRIHAAFQNCSKDDIDVENKLESVLDVPATAAAGEGSYKVDVEKTDSNHSPKDTILQKIKNHEHEDGMEYNDLIEEVDASEDRVENIIDALLSNRIVYEPKPGRVKEL